MGIPFIIPFMPFIIGMGIPFIIPFIIGICVAGIIMVSLSR